MKGTALVTGGSRGIGAAIAKGLAADGLHVVVNYRANEAAAEATVEAIRAAGGTATAVRFDVRDAKETSERLAAIEQEAGHVAVLVNNAGIARDAAFPALALHDWEAVTRTTLDGFYNVTKPLVMGMVRARWGRIVNVASVSGVTGNRGQVNYSAAKAGLIGATRSLALELAKRNVTVNAVAPGLIETDMLAGAPVEQLLEHVPMRRLGTPTEVADLVRFLASDRAGYVTGQVIGINGGLA
jgi:3-oxoacyl-[acyl-carrier protein] reductase